MKACEFNLQDIIQFVPSEGKVLIGSERVLLFRKDAFASLRDMIMEQVGPTLAHSILMKFAYRNGKQDYYQLSKLFAWESELDRLSAGPLMHAWCGITQVEAQHLEYDRDRGYFHFKGRWHNSFEAQIHLESYGRSEKPVCSTLTGYGSGWCSAFFGKPVLEIETKCVACGDPYCEWEIKTVDAWGEEARFWKDSLFLNHESIFKRLEDKSEDLDVLNNRLSEIVEEKTRDNQFLVKVLCHDLTSPLQVIEEFLANRSLANSCDKDQWLRTSQSLDAIKSLLEEVRLQQKAIKSLEVTHSDTPQMSVSEVVEYLNVVFYYKIKQKNLRLNVEDGSSGRKFIGSKTIVNQQIFQNIVSNAIKFSSRDSTIDITASIKDSCIQIDVKDYGVGIPASVLQKIIKDEEYPSAKGTCGEEGTGFGLGIIRHYVNSLGGQLFIKSTSMDVSIEESGTTMTVLLPLASQAA